MLRHKVIISLLPGKVIVIDTSTLFPPPSPPAAVAAAEALQMMRNEN